MKNIKKFREFLNESEDDKFLEFIIESEGYLLESADAKDIKRINDLITKSKGSEDKQIQLANTMAKSIKNKVKSNNRYDAAYQILGPEHPVTNIFANKAKELGNDVKVLKPKEDSINSKPEFVYDNNIVDDVWERFLGFVKKLRGRNWGSAFDRKLKKQFTPEELIHLSIKCEGYVNMRSSEWSYMYGDYPKLLSAIRDPRRVVKYNNYLDLFDFGTAKADASNPAHVLFKKQRELDKTEANLEELRASCQLAFTNYKRPDQMFKDGETYITYGSQRNGGGRLKRGSTILFDNPWAMYFWNNNMIGQMSDGHWENSKKYEGEWRYWSSLVPTFTSSVVQDPWEGNPEGGFMNPKTVQKWAVQTDEEYLMVGKVASMNSPEFFPLIGYTKSYTIKNVKTLENAEKLANKYGIELDKFLAFLACPTMAKSKVKAIVSKAHTDMIISMKTKM